MCRANGFRLALSGSLVDTVPILGVLIGLKHERLPDLGMDLMQYGDFYEVIPKIRARS